MTSKVAPANPTDHVESLLSTLTDLQRHHDRLNAQYQQAHEELERAYAKLISDVLADEAMIEQVEKELSSHLKRKRTAIFGDRDKVTLKHGIIQWAKSRVLHIPHDALETLKTLSLRKGIKILESINRPEIETWPDDKLTAIGAAWRTENKFKWEVKK